MKVYQAGLPKTWAQNGLSRKSKTKMVRMIRVYVLGRNGLEMKEASLEKAETVLKETYADSLGGLVTGRRTGKVI
jgi:hypothetical protein